MNRPQQRLPQPGRKGGFAIIVALALMSAVLLLLLALTALTRVEAQSATTANHQLQAQQAALLGLHVALGELQKAAGPDQRVTATADVLDDLSNVYTGGLDVPIGQNSWVGVWKSDTVAEGTPSYDPSTPNRREFVGWLVSGRDPDGNFRLPDMLADVSTNVGAPSSTNGMHNYVSLFNKSDGTPYAQVEKIRFDSGNEVDGYFAFHIEDEGVKADLSWSEMPLDETTPDRYQSSRLSSVPGPDYGVLNGALDNGPFEGIAYPLTIDGSSVLKNVFKIQDPADLTAGMNDSATASDWLKDSRGDLTWGSRGVLADVKWGGLRRDLSLAFEMDGDADVTANEQPRLFNQQFGEFVGGNDRLAAPNTALGMPVPERFLYRVTTNDGSPFSADLERDDSVVRGPNWWAMRDYATLYKRLRSSGGSYSLDARSYYPNVSAASGAQARFYTLGYMYGPNSGAYPWDSDQYNRPGPAWLLPPDRYIFRPARSNYAPVLLGAACMYSATTVNYDPAAETADLARCQLGLADGGHEFDAFLQMQAMQSKP